MRYDVFISYSQAGDSLLSERVQEGLARFAKPWWRRRALSVFRDRSSLTANPGLWSSIAEAIDDSRFFLLLASPEAASSSWCAREVEQWRSRRGADGLLVLLTDGDIAWDDNNNDFDWQATTALTPAIAGCFVEAPRYVDMRWARSEVQLDLTDGRFRDQIAELAAPARGMTRDELAGTGVRQHRRTLRHAFAAGMALILLTLAAIGGFVDAKIQRNDAIQARNAAVRSAARARTQQKKADVSKKDANRQRTVAEQRKVDADGQRAIAEQRKKDADRQRAIAEKQSLLAQASAERANDQTELAELQRTAGVARGLLAGSQTSLATGSTDRALLLAAEAAKFASSSGGLLADADVKPSLVNALQDNPRLVGWLRGLTGAIASVTVAPDDSRVAAITADGHVAVWSLPDERLLATFSALGTSYSDGSLLFLGRDVIAISGRSRLDTYRADAGATNWAYDWTWKSPRRGSWVLGFATSSDHLIVATATESQQSSRLDVLDATGHRVRGVRTPDLFDVERMTFASSGKRFAIAGRSATNVENGYVVRLFTLSGHQVRSYPINPTDVQPAPGADCICGGLVDLRFSRNGRHLAVLLSGYRAPIYRIKIPGGRPIADHPPYNGWSAVAPEYRRGLAPDLKTIVQRDPEDAASVGVGNIATGTFTPNLHAPVALGLGGGQPAFTANGQLFLMPDGDGVVPVFQLGNTPNFHFARVQTLRDRLGGLIPSPDGRTVASFDSQTRLTLRRLDGSQGVIKIPIAPRLQFAGFGSSALAFDTHGAAIAVANRDGSVDVYDTSTGASLRHLDPPGPLVSESRAPGYRWPEVAFFGSIGSGRIAEATGDGELWVWDLPSGAAAGNVLKLPGDESSGDVHISASGSRIVVTTYSGPKSTVHVVDFTRKGWTERRPVVLPEYLAAEALSPDGRRLAGVTSTTDNLTLLDLDDGTPVWTRQADDLATFGVWFAPDGSLFTESSATGKIRDVSTVDGSVRYTLDLTGGATKSFFESNYSQISVAFAGEHLITTGSRLGSVYVTDWSLATSDLVAAACNEAGRNLTRAEWNQYVGPVDAYEKTCAAFAAGP